MRIKADFDLCESNALCEAMAPEVFELDDDDYLQLKTEETTEENIENVKRAVAACPRAAPPRRPTQALAIECAPKKPIVTIPMPAITATNGRAAVRATPASSTATGTGKTWRRPTRPASAPNQAELADPRM